MKVSTDAASKQERTMRTGEGREGLACAQEAAGEEALRHRGERLRGAAEEKHFLLCAAQQPRHLRAHLPLPSCLS